MPFAGKVTLPLDPPSFRQAARPRAYRDKDWHRPKPKPPKEWEMA